MTSKLTVLMNLTETNIFHYFKDPHKEFTKFKFMMKLPPPYFRNDHWNKVATVEGDFKPFYEPILITNRAQKKELLDKYGKLTAVQRYLEELNDCCSDGTRITWLKSGVMEKKLDWNPLIQQTFSE